MITEIQIEVRSTEIDVNGHVNNAKYLEYYEWGREDWYERAGLDFATITEMNIGTVVVNINVNYRKEVRQGEHLTIRTAPERLGRTSFVLKQELINEAGQVVNDAVVTTVTINLQTRQPAPVPEQIARFFGK
jgi:thioesterase-3